MTHGASLATDVSLTASNTLGLSARARQLFVLEDSRGLPAAAGFLAHNRNALVIGGGSNLVLACDEVAAVLSTRLRGRRIVGHDADSAVVELAAGENWHESVLWTLENELFGLENLALIPGSVGAAPVQNIGAYGVEIAGRVIAVEVMDRRDGSIAWLPGENCAFGYRTSRFKVESRRWLILSLRLRLDRHYCPVLDYADLANRFGERAGGTHRATDIADAVIDIRQRKLPDPALIGNAGSFFRNPVVPRGRAVALNRHLRQMRTYGVPGHPDLLKLPAAHLIEQAGWKGRSIGGAAIHDQHALVLVNHGSASGSDVLDLARAVQADIYRRYGICLEPEPLVVRA